MVRRLVIFVIVLAVTFGSTLVLGVSVVHAAPAGTPDDPIPLDSCRDMDGDDEPATYELTKDLEAPPDDTCIGISIPGNTILGNGHTIRGSGSGTGIAVAFGAVPHNVEIHDVTVTGFETGLDVGRAESVYVYNSTFTNNSKVGITSTPAFGFEGVTYVHNSTIARNGDGITGLVFVSESRVVDNERYGAFLDAFGSISRSVIAGNGEMGVRSGEPENSVPLDARYNFWGASDGPSSANSTVPFADPITGALANGSGDSINNYFGEYLFQGSVGHPPVIRTTNESNVHFDPFLTSPLGESTYDGHYQIDLVVGDPIPQLSAERLYTDERRLVGFLHGQGDEVERTGTAPTLTAEYDDCYDVRSWTVENGTATVEYTVAEDCSSDLTLVSYEKPGSGFNRATADQQRLYDTEDRETQSGDRTYVLMVDLPEASSNDDETDSLATPSDAFAHSLMGVR